jgi:hypothetical protein
LHSRGAAFNGLMVELHVLPDATTGGWTLNGSWFATLNEAEEAAGRVADARIFLHDRYHRVRALVQR